MTAYFLDTSALVKRYVTEIGSTWVQDIAALNTDKLNIAQITWVEFFSALARRQREGSLPASDMNEIIQDFRVHLATHGLDGCRRGRSPFAFECSQTAISYTKSADRRCLQTRCIQAAKLHSASRWGEASC